MDINDTSGIHILYLICTFCMYQDNNDICLPLHASMTAVWKLPMLLISLSLSPTHTNVRALLRARFFKWGNNGLHTNTQTHKQTHTRTLIAFLCVCLSVYTLPAETRRPEMHTQRYTHIHTHTLSLSLSNKHTRTHIVCVSVRLSV